MPRKKRKFYITPSDVRGMYRDTPPEKRDKANDEQIMFRHTVGPYGVNCWSCGERYPCTTVNDMIDRWTNTHYG